MDNFIERVIQEKSELDEKKVKLEVFKNSDKFNGINAIQRSLLTIQLQAMNTYSECLEQRLIWLSPQESVD
jgi:dephospho-CoA kinase